MDRQISLPSWTLQFISHRASNISVHDKTQTSTCLKDPCGPKGSITNCLQCACKFTNTLHSDMEKINILKNLSIPDLIFLMCPCPVENENENKTKKTARFFSPPVQQFNYCFWVMLSLQIERRSAASDNTSGCWKTIFSIFCAIHNSILQIQHTFKSNWHY